MSELVACNIHCIVMLLFVVCDVCCLYIDVYVYVTFFVDVNKLSPVWQASLSLSLTTNQPMVCSFALLLHCCTDDDFYSFLYIYRTHPLPLQPHPVVRSHSFMPLRVLYVNPAPATIFVRDAQ